jgi:ectoine hydroxylase-related dioxygenase (phytanoyl-CoA dioxygenase family)
MPSLQHFCLEDSDEDILLAIEQDGACIFEHLIPGALCDRMMAEFRPHIDAAPWANNEPLNKGESDEFFGQRTKRFHALLSLSPSATELVTHSRLLGLADAFIGTGERCRELKISTTELMVLGGGQTPQMLHRDADSWMYLSRDARRRLLFSANVAMCDFTGTNGATVVAPGSHRWPDTREARDEEVCLATMPKGSALLYRGDVLHGGGENTEASIRTGFYLGYIPSWLAPLENHALSNDAAAIATLDEPVKRLLNVSRPFATFP